MSGLATRRLIDAAARLDPADRALLNLWVNRGLDNERLTDLTGMSLDVLQARREKIVSQLAADLGLPEQDIRGALDQISPDDEAFGPPDPNGAGYVVPSHNGAATVPPTPTGSPRHRRRGLWLGLVALVVIVAAVIVIVAAGGSSSSPRRTAASAPRTPTTAAETSTVPIPHPNATPVPVPLTGLPGGLMHASGSVKLSGPVKHLRLNLRVLGLPVARDGHYEIWLYNSVLDSQPLARLRNGHHRLTVSLPRSARHYRWIDISFQPVGVINHSGESELRASNPAHTTMARLHKHSARTRHRLRQASKVSAAQPVRPPSHRSQPARHRAGPHRLARSAKGSSKAKRSK